MIQTAFIANAGQEERDTIGYSDYSRISDLQKSGKLPKVMLSSSSMSPGHARLEAMIYTKRDRD